MTLLDEVLERLARADDATKAALRRELAPTASLKWMPTFGPQADAFYSKADTLLYGGQGGGGKSDLLLGLAFTAHRRSLIVRRYYTDITALIDRVIEINGTRRGFNGSIPPSLRTDDARLIELGGCARAGDEEHWQGRPHDFLGLEEAAQLLEGQARFLMGWVRTTLPNQRTRIVMATNPPLSSEGQWLFEMFRPWVDDSYPEPARPSELRWYVTNEDGRDLPVDGPEPVEIGGRMVAPLSRTFIPASLSDNPYIEPGYQAKLDALPEPLRSAIRDGDFKAGRRDEPNQVFPSEWVFAAQSRWTEEPPKHAPMSAMGVDVAQGGTAETVLACRYDAWFAPLVAVPGRETPFGSDVAGLVIKHRRNEAVIVIDMGGGFGGGAFEHLKANGLSVHGFRGSDGSSRRTKDRQLGFFNKRAEATWRFREALDPDQPGGSPVALPPDQRLLADLVAMHFETTPRGIKIEDKDELSTRLGRSPDRGDAVVMAWSEGPVAATHGEIWRRMLQSQHRPNVIHGYEQRKRR